MSGEEGRPVPSYAIERQLEAAGATRIAGVDEVGRGAWAGSVVACAVVTDLSPPPDGLADSKLLTELRRTRLVDVLTDWAVGVGYGEATPAEIDELGLTEALRRAAVRALDALPTRPDVVIVDGKHDYLGAPWAVRCEVKADACCVSVAAASVLAKVHRDAQMARLDPEHPAYEFAENAGYPSPTHKRALAAYGPTPYHRLSWSYLDELPEWRHLKKHRHPSVGAGQLALDL
ncbi:MAG: ribonuclease HII [Streptosporangiales bacterium]|nr:ribonuclease HII [Streptosporangiales bacterium]